MRMMIVENFFFEDRLHLRVRNNDSHSKAATDLTEVDHKVSKPFP